ncbi:hypothetical protein POJ06DRAFT_239177 [Lipomyces tetrasporus]|uniref:Uncharacterized protein n=1 Tax=Lipomyces tetrasporus TaxID=54092 RepID=A0AAD7QQ20_9ASCO|nr:uncharacterized protein POJ06DRAFT_239177 [Lipomyces tetrasporus]KAJ8099284.1 hypothetical protein POJ06DRAFT_239177 [Lipomyces tetrasporus]
MIRPPGKLAIVSDSFIGSTPYPHVIRQTGFWRSKHGNPLLLFFYLRDWAPVARNETRLVATAKLLVPSTGFYHRQLRRLRIDTEIHGVTFEKQQTLPLVIVAMENPHEQVQNALLARIITNVTKWNYIANTGAHTFTNSTAQEKLNEAIIVLNRVLQVGIRLLLRRCCPYCWKAALTWLLPELMIAYLGRQQRKYERRAIITDVGELSTERVVQSRKHRLIRKTYMRRIDVEADGLRYLRRVQIESSYAICQCRQSG